jgi:hypothetical protein
VTAEGGEHQRGLVFLVEGGVGVLVAGFDEDATHIEVAEGGGEVEVGVGEPFGGGIGVVEEVRVGFEDASDEEGVVGSDCAADAERGVNPAGVGR